MKAVSAGGGYGFYELNRSKELKAYVTSLLSAAAKAEAQEKVRLVLGRLRLCMIRIVYM